MINTESNTAYRCAALIHLFLVDIKEFQIVSLFYDISMKVISKRSGIVDEKGSAKIPDRILLDTAGTRVATGNGVKQKRAR